MGSGGVGGYFGAKLAKGGADVTFIARGAHLAAMREHGLAIESEHAPITLPKVNAADDPATIGPVDLVLFAVKLWDTEAAAEMARPLVGRIRASSRCRTASTVWSASRRYSARTKSSAASPTSRPSSLRRGW